MSSPPTGVLSEQLAAQLRGRRVLALVFTTFQLDLGFFELQVLPVFFEGVLGAAEALRRRQLGEEIPSVPAGIAVYYDRHGLVPSGGPARLDVRRIPIAHPTGTFHPKNLFVLLEARTPDEEGHKAQALLVGCLSANLTQSGWWTNLEVAHFVEIAEGEHTSLRDGLLASDRDEGVQFRVIGFDPLQAGLHQLRRCDPAGADGCRCGSKAGRGPWLIQLGTGSNGRQRR